MGIENEQTGFMDEVDGFYFNRKLSNKEKVRIGQIIELARESVKTYLKSLSTDSPGYRIGSFDPDMETIFRYVTITENKSGKLSNEEIEIFTQFFIHECNMGYPKYEA